MAIIRKAPKKLPSKARVAKPAPVRCASVNRPPSKRSAVKSRRAKAKAPKRLTNRVRQKFLDMLAETSNVAGSARAAGINTSLIYAERRKNPAFMAQWAISLAEGYARLEADLLAEALQVASGKIGEVTLKSRAQKHRLALALLSAHRASVKGMAGEVRLPVTKGGMTKNELLTKLTDMKLRQAAAAQMDKRADNDAA